MEFETKQAWRRMVGRCVDPRYDGYHGAGICDRWRDYPKFLEDMGPKPSRWHGLQRLDRGRPFEPGNVQWGEDGLEFEGIRRTVREWAERLGLKEETLYARLRKGWPTEKAFGEVLRGGKESRHTRSMWALRANGVADGVEFRNQLSNPYGTMREALESWRSLASRCRANGYSCRVELLRQSPEEADWVVVLAFPV